MHRKIIISLAVMIPACGLLINHPAMAQTNRFNFGEDVPRLDPGTTISGESLQSVESRSLEDYGKIFNEGKDSNTKADTELMRIKNNRRFNVTPLGSDSSPTVPRPNDGASSGFQLPLGF